ncbi:MAG: type II toxin-antitoxin system VapC family toxin [Pseudomonadota bacterium]
MASAVTRWVRMEELTEPEANRIESAFHQDIDLGRFTRRPAESSHYRRAIHWISKRRTSLRTLDALHLACAAHHQACLVSEDAALIDAAEFLGLSSRRA